MEYPEQRCSKVQRNVPLHKIWIGEPIQLSDRMKMTMEWGCWHPVKKHYLHPPVSQPECKKDGSTVGMFSEARTSEWLDVRKAFTKIGSCSHAPVVSKIVWSSCTSS